MNSVESKRPLQPRNEHEDGWRRERRGKVTFVPDGRSERRGILLEPDRAGIRRRTSLDLDSCCAPPSKELVTCKPTPPYMIKNMAPIALLHRDRPLDAAEEVASHAIGLCHVQSEVRNVLIAGNLHNPLEDLTPPFTTRPLTTRSPLSGPPNPIPRICFNLVYNWSGVFYLRCRG